MTTATDLDAFRAFLDEFEPYLKADTVFWTVRADLPALTVGGVLLIRRTLAVRRRRLPVGPAADYDRLESQAGALFNSWPVNIEKKALKEIAARLSQWSGMQEDLGEGYSTAVTPRVHLSLLLAFVARRPEAGSFQKRLAGLDARLRARLVGGEFVWEADLAEAFPRAEFWFLYGRPSARP